MLFPRLTLAGMMALAVGTARDESPEVSGVLRTCRSGADRAWTALRDHRKQLALVEEAKALPQGALFEGKPFDCGLRAAVRCAPDMDGDGAAELLARLDWEERPAPEGAMEDTAAMEFKRCHALRQQYSTPYAAVLLLLSSKRPGVPGRALVVADETPYERGPTRVDFVRWQGQPALRRTMRRSLGASGKAEYTEVVIVLRDGALIPVSSRPLGQY